MSDALCCLVNQNMGRWDQNKKLHLTKTTQIEVLVPRVGDGADLGKEAPCHAQLRWIDLKGFM